MTASETQNTVCECGHWAEEHHDGECDGCKGYPLHHHDFRESAEYTAEALAELEASA